MTYDLPSREMAAAHQRDRVAAIVADQADTGEYAVYTLRCERPASDDELLDRLDDYYPLLDEQREYDGPDWAQQAVYADELYYVGQTEDLSSRLKQHVRGTSGAALFTTLFPPQELVSVEWIPDADMANKREMDRKRGLNDLEIGRQLIRDPLESELFTGRLSGLMEYDAEMYLEEHDTPRKQHVFVEWKRLFLESLEEWGSGNDAVEEWLETDPIEPPDQPLAPLQNARRLEKYWKVLIDRIPGYIEEINEFYHRQAVTDATDTVRVAYSL